MLQTPRPVGRPKKRGEIKKSFSLAVVPSRIFALDYLVEHFNLDSRGDLVVRWIEREMQSIKGDNWLDHTDDPEEQGLEDAA